MVGQLAESWIEIEIKRPDWGFFLDPEGFSIYVEDNGLYDYASIGTFQLVGDDGNAYAFLALDGVLIAKVQARPSPFSEEQVGQLSG